MADKNKNFEEYGNNYCYLETVSENSKNNHEYLHICLLDPITISCKAEWEPTIAASIAEKASAFMNNPLLAGLGAIQSSPIQTVLGENYTRRMYKKTDYINFDLKFRAYENPNVLNGISTQDIVLAYLRKYGVPKGGGPISRGIEKISKVVGKSVETVNDIKNIITGDTKSEFTDAEVIDMQKNGGLLDNINRMYIYYTNYMMTKGFDVSSEIAKSTDKYRTTGVEVKGLLECELFKGITDQLKTADMLQSKISKADKVKALKVLESSDVKVTCFWANKKQVYDRSIEFDPGKIKTDATETKKLRDQMNDILRDETEKDVSGLEYDWAKVKEIDDNRDRIAGKFLDAHFKAITEAKALYENSINDLRKDVLENKVLKETKFQQLSNKLTQNITIEESEAYNENLHKLYFCINKQTITGENNNLDNTKGIVVIINSWTMKRDTFGRYSDFSISCSTHTIPFINNLA